MKVAIVGAGGLVGKEFTRQFSKDHQVLPLTHNDLDITDAHAVRRVIFAEHPALILNCAVLGVDACELKSSLAWSVNVSGAEYLAKTADAIDAEFVQISSNYVFDGQRRSGSCYTIEDIPNPISVYGQTKLASERAVSAVSHRCFIIRTSWVFGVGKENFFSTAHRSLKSKKKIRAITDVWANCTYVRDLVIRVVEILSHRHYSTYHVVNSGLCSYYDFAVEAAYILDISDSELAQLIEPAESCEVQRNAKRPPYTPMRCTVSEEIGLAPLRDWSMALAEYIRDDFA
jgi:dTDP-4-dehydrorhamnose reductase